MVMLCGQRNDGHGTSNGLMRVAFDVQTADSTSYTVADARYRIPKPPVCAPN